MIEGRRVLAVVPARGGSRGLRKKNILNLCGKPLIAWTIEAANSSASIDRCIISTECQEIRSVALAAGGDVPFVRPAELARDDTPGIEPILHASEQYPEYEVVVVLQPTSPLRTTNDIDRALRLFVEKDASFCVSVTSPKHHPNWMFSRTSSGTLERLEEAPAEACRQSLNEVFALNGAIYIAYRTALFREKTLVGSSTFPYIMPANRSFDIDSEFDMSICEAILTNAIREEGLPTL